MSRHYYQKGEVPPGLAAYQEEQRQKKREARENRERLEEAAPPEMTEEMRQILLEFQQNAERKTAAEALDILAKQLDAIPQEQVALLTETPSYKEIVRKAAEARRERVPGGPRYDASGRIIGMEPWRREDFAQYEKIRFIGDKNEVFSFNGVQFVVGDGIPTELPAPVYDYWVNLQRERKIADSGDRTFEWLQRVTGGKATRS